MIQTNATYTQHLHRLSISPVRPAPELHAKQRSTSPQFVLLRCQYPSPAGLVSFAGPLLVSCPSPEKLFVGRIVCRERADRLLLVSSIDVIDVSIQIRRLGRNSYVGIKLTSSLRCCWVGLVVEVAVPALGFSRTCGVCHVAIGLAMSSCGPICSP